MTDQSVRLLARDQFAQEVIQHQGKVLVDFFGDHCTGCRAMEPVLSDLALETTGIKFAKLDVVEAPEIASRLRISALPTFILFENGQPTKQLVGAKTKKQFSEWLHS